MSEQLTFRDRIVAAGLVIAILGVLIVARQLQPDPRGLGTHEQLGLPPCHFYQYTGIPCPQCGMTTSFCHLAHGQWLAAWRVHPCGPLLAVLLTGVILPWSVLAVVSGRSWGTRRPGWMLLSLIIGYAFVALAVWIARM